MLEFSRPIWLLLLLVLPVMWWLALRMSYASLGPWQKWISIGVRTAVWLLLVFSLAGAQFVRISDRVSVVVVRDSSDSVDDAQFSAAVAQIEEARKEMRKDDTLGMVNFGRNAYLEYLPRGGVQERELREWQTDPLGNFTNLAEAVRLGTAIFPDNAQKRLVVLTDGNENMGNSLAEARVARDNGVELMVVPMGSTEGAEVVLASLEAPPQASVGETVNVRFVLDSNVATPGEVSLLRGGEFIDKVAIDIRPGKEVYEFPMTVDESGFLTFELIVEPEVDTIAENNRAYTFSVVEGQPRLLYATGDPAELAYLPETWRTHNIAVDVVPPSGIPYSLDDFQTYDGIIFSDVAAFDITEDQMKMIQVMVRDFGRGFMMVGGDKSFGVGGYFNTPIEETLPVDMDFRRKRITPSSLVVCLVDKSGSMGATVNGVEKINMAKEACKEVVKLQQDDDWVGVMGFDGAGQWVVQPTRGVNKEQTLSQISSMVAGGGTDLYPALAAAYEQAKDVPAQIKHFIIFTDGMVAPGDFNGLVSQMVEDKMTISTVAFGTDADIPFMRDLADMGEGSMYEANTLYDLPRIFTREVFMANKATLTEEPFHAVPTGNDALVSNIAWNYAPPLYGYVATSPKDAAQVQLVTHKDDPLLATWRYGLGKSAAFTSDAKNRWARDWLEWNGYERFWTGVARWIRNDLDNSGVDVVTSMVGGEGIVQVSAFDPEGGFINYPRLEARVTDPDMGGETVTLEQTGPGEYEGRFQVEENGNYFVNVVGYGEGEDGQMQPASAQSSGLAVSYSPEYRNLKPNQFLLAQLQSSSLMPEGVNLTGLFTEERKPTRRLEDAWELFTLIGLLLWLVDVAVRRLSLDMTEMREAAGAFAGFGGRRAAQVSESLSGLLTVKERATTRRTTAESQQAVQQRQQELQKRVQQKESAGIAKERSEPAESAPAGNIEANRPVRRGDQAASSLSQLRRKLDDNDKKPKFDLSNIGKSGGNDSGSKPAPRRDDKPDVTAKEMTSRLLNIKRKDKDKDKD